MTLSRVVLVTTALAFTLLQACSSSSTDGDGESADQEKLNTAFATSTPPTFVDTSINVDQHFADSTDATSPTQLTVTTAGNEAMIGKVTVGTILAGNRNSTNIDPTTSTNAFGFLRRVTGITTTGPNTVYTTVAAELDEWIKDGDLDFTNPSSLFTTTTSEIGAKSLEVLDTPPASSASGGGSGSASTAANHEFDGDEKDAGNGIKVKPVIRLANAKMSLNAQYDGYFKVRTIVGLPRSATFKSLLTVDPVFTADIQAGVSVQGQGPLAIGTINGITIADLQVDLLPGAIIPIAAPIPITVRFHPRLKCTLSASGEATVTVNGTLRSHAAVGFEGSASPTSITMNDISQQPTFTPTFAFKGGTVKADLGIQCAFLVVPEVLAFDAVGLSGEVGPYLNYDATLCVNGNYNTQTVDGGFTLAEQHGLSMSFNARAQLPIIGIGNDKPLLTVSTLKSKPNYLVGTATTCSLKTQDSCQGRQDGFYCSVVSPYAGINCKGGSVLNGLQCSGGTSQKCVSGTTTTINCQ